MTLKVKFMLVLMLPFFTSAAFAQEMKSDKIKPQWLHKLPQPTNSTFRYEIVTASASSLETARKESLNTLITNSGFSSGVVVSSDYKSNEILSQKWNNGRLTETVDYEAQTIISTKGEERKLFVESIDEYWERDGDGSYYLTKLYAKSELEKTPLFDNLDLTTKYGVNGLWRSAIVPGWGQIYKGSTLKGAVIFGGTAILAGSIIFTENQRSDYAYKVTTTKNLELKRAYATKSNNFATGSYICIGATAALYLYNLIDAVVSPGARRIVVKERSNSKYAIVPTISMNGEPSIIASITF